MQKLMYYSTNLITEPVSFREALLKGLAGDKGLFMPVEIPTFSPEEILSFSQKAYHEIAFEVMRKFLTGEIDDQLLKELTKDAYDFEIPLEQVIGNKFIMRLDQGPTASFKDFAARMMGRLMNHYLKQDQKKLLILTATSGDTGSAIANAFYGLESIQVLVLFPEGEVTNRQRKQMTTLGRNIQIVELKGKFDDCQALVKQAFSDSELEYLDLSSANSINIGRLIPQIVYYFYAFSRLRKGNLNDSIVFSVPSGNFGDMMGGVIGMKMGLPVKKFAIATNENDEFTTFLQTGIYEKIEPSRNCISSAMNVGHPSNLARLVALYGGVMDETGRVHIMPDMDKMRRELFATSVSDKATRDTIIEAWELYRVLLEPHGAVAWKGLIDLLECNPEIEENELCVVLETAHPAKFPEEINNLLGIDPELPASLLGIEEKEEKYDQLPKDYEAFKAYLKNKY